MARLLRITHCTECKYKQWALMTPKPQCWHKDTYGMILDFPLGIFREEIPEWCKLEDAPEEGKIEQLRSALERIRPIPSLILQGKSVRNLDEIYAECDRALEVKDD